MSDNSFHILMGRFGVHAGIIFYHVLVFFIFRDPRDVTWGEMGFFRNGHRCEIHGLLKTASSRLQQLTDKREPPDNTSEQRNSLQSDPLYWLKEVRTSQKYADTKPNSNKGPIGILYGPY